MVNMFGYSYFLNRFPIMGSLPNGKSRFTMMPTKTSIKAVFTTSASNDGIYLLEAVIAANKANATTT